MTGPKLPGCKKRVHHPHQDEDERFRAGRSRDVAGMLRLEAMARHARAVELINARLPESYDDLPMNFRRSTP